MKIDFFLWTKILIKIKTRDKKMFTKKIHEGEGVGGNFHGGKLPPRKMPPKLSYSIPESMLRLNKF